MIKNLNIHALKRMRNRLNRLYGPQVVEHLLERMVALIGRYGVGFEGYSSTLEQRWSETSSVLITYGDMIQKGDEPPLQVLKRFADQHLSGAINTIHILPFCPYSSDDGFSVIDYREVDPGLGSWDDIQELGSGFKLMFDLVLNHVSRRSKWFSDYIANIAPYRDFFIEADPEADLSAVTRPRNLPLLTPVHTRHGDVHLRQVSVLLFHHLRQDQVGRLILALPRTPANTTRRSGRQRRVAKLTQRTYRHGHEVYNHNLSR